MGKEQSRSLQKSPTMSGYTPVYYNQFNKKWTDDEIMLVGDELVAWMKLPANYYITRFCTQNMICRQRIAEWAAKNEYFSQCLDIAKGIQESKLVDMGITNGKNCGMAIFVLKNVAGMRDRQEIEHSGSIEERVRNMSTEERKVREKQLIAKLKAKVKNDASKANSESEN